jgi:hypothetical protein
MWLNLLQSNLCLWAPTEKSEVCSSLLLKSINIPADYVHEFISKAHKVASNFKPQTFSQTHREQATFWQNKFANKRNSTGTLNLVSLSI